MKRFIAFFIPLVLFVAAALGGGFLQNANIDHWRQLPFKYRDTLYLPSSQYVKAVSVGYDQFVADFLWLRMIQSFAADYSSDDNADRMWSYYNVITDLDPKFADVYTFAVMGIGEAGRENATWQIRNHPELENKHPNPIERVDNLVKQVCDKGIERNFGDYHAPYDGAFYSFYTMNDANLAKYYLRMAKMDPDHPDYIERWEGYFDLKQGRYRAAYEKYLTDFVHAVQAGNQDLYPILRSSLNRAINAWFVDVIKQRAVQWQKDHGGDFPTFEQLAQAGALNDVELPDVTRVNQLLGGLLDGVIKLDDKAQLNRIIQGLVHPFAQLPPSPYDLFDPKYTGFVIWRGLQPTNSLFVLHKIGAYGKAQELAANTTAAADAYKAKHNGQEPASLADFAPDMARIKDPWGGRWIWDAKKHLVYSETCPNINDLQLPNP